MSLPREPGVVTLPGLPGIELGKPAARPSKRREHDVYLTSDWATQELLKAYPEVRGGRLLDPCCGDGRMAKALQGRFETVLLNDIQPKPDLAQWRMDARNPELYAEARPDWVVTNPSFLYAGGIAWTALQHARVGVALLLRCTFLEPCEGREWLTRRPPTAVLSLPRISFTGGGTDSAACLWFLWGPVAPGIRVVTGKEQLGLFAEAGPRPAQDAHATGSSRGTEP